MSDTVEESAAPEADPKVAKVEAELEKVEEEAAKVEEKLDDPSLPDAQVKKLETRLESLDERMDKLIEKLDKLAASPVAPAPQKTVADMGKPEASKVEEQAPEEPKVRKAYVSRRWFGERAYGD